MSSKYTWSRMTPNPVAHLTTPGDEFAMPLCGARLDVRTQTLGDQSPSQYVPVCGRCEARQRRVLGLASRFVTFADLDRGPADPTDENLAAAFPHVKPYLFEAIRQQVAEYRAIAAEQELDR